MRYVVVGAGAVGGTIGGRLDDAGHEVVLVARGAHAAAMREHGLRLAMPDRILTVHPAVVDDVRRLRLRADDVLLLATKTQDTLGVLDALLAAEAGSVAVADLPVVCVQNGVANERFALRRFSRVYGCVVMLPAVLLDPGRIDAQGTPFSGLLDLGSVPHGRDDIAEQVAADLSGSGFTSVAVPDVMRWKYAKLLRNLGNAVEALCGHDLDDDAMAAVRALDERLRSEAVQVFAAAGIEWASDEEWQQRRGTQVEHAPVEGRARFGGSSWQSLARGAGTIETDYLNGEVVLLGRLHGIPTPVNAGLQRAATRAVRDRAAAGSMTVSELMTELAVEEGTSR